LFVLIGHLPVCPVIWLSRIMQFSNADVVKKFIFRYLDLPLRNDSWNILVGITNKDIFNKFIELNKFLSNVCIIQVIGIWLLYSRGCSFLYSRGVSLSLPFPQIPRSFLLASSCAFLNSSTYLMFGGTVKSMA